MSRGSEQRWIVIPRWDGKDGFQHYSDRDPTWIKDYRNQLAKDEYRDLSFHLRGILHGLRLSYAASNRQLRDDTVALTRRLGHRVTRRDLESLNHAGFIRFSASKPLARRYRRASPDKEVREEKKVHVRSRAKSETPEAKIRRLIQNGVITDDVDLEAELRAHGAIGVLADVLRAELRIKREEDAA